MGLGDTDEFEGFAEDGVLDVVDAGGAFEFGVFDDDLLLKGAMLRKVDVFIDGGGDEETAVRLIVGREIGAAAAERDAEG